jgi:hypothetical protein
MPAGVGSARESRHGLLLDLLGSEILYGVKTRLARVFN